MFVSYLENRKVKYVHILPGRSMWGERDSKQEALSVALEVKEVVGMHRLKHAIIVLYYSPFMSPSTDMVCSQLLKRYVY